MTTKTPVPVKSLTVNVHVRKGKSAKTPEVSDVVVYLGTSKLAWGVLGGRYNEKQVVQAIRRKQPGLNVNPEVLAIANALGLVA